MRCDCIYAIAELGMKVARGSYKAHTSKNVIM
jgi:hypothetical protein